MSVRLTGLALFTAASSTALACTDLGPGGVPSSIAFDSLPYPSVVVGDTLRDGNGVVVPLSASVFDSRNTPLPDADVRFVALDPGVRITDDDLAIGETFGQNVRVVAQVGGLQSVPLRLLVTRRPDGIHAVGATELTLEYSPGEVVTSEAMTVRVVHDTPPEPGDTVVQGWIVHYEVVGHAPGDTVPGYLIDGSRRAQADTTDASGVAALRFRLNSATLPVLEDTLEVRASASHKGEPLAGSPVSFILLIRPRSTS